MERSGHYPQLVVANYRSLLQSLLVAVWLCGVGIFGSSGAGGGGQNCLQLFDTYSQGVYVCQHHSDLIVALQIAEELGREECQRAFERDIWNCSGFSILKAPNVTSLATKEAAYVHALSLAAIAHSVAKVCAVGDVTSCSCDTERLELPATDSESRYAMGCSDNVGFGLNFAAQFLRLRHSITTADSLQEGATNAQWREVFLHNLRTAAEVVRGKTSVSTMPCKCLGVSGTCTVLSCPQQKYSEFSILAEEILRIYLAYTCQLTSTGAAAATTRDLGNGSTGGNNDRVSPQITESAGQQRSCSPPDERHFLFLDESPNYCVRDVVVGSLGTAGRECDPHATGPNSCENLCTRCGRGHVSIEESTESNCWCEFVFCCEIRCSKCPERRRYHVCT
jgi:hypothetical protein